MWSRQHECNPQFFFKDSINKKEIAQALAKQENQKSLRIGDSLPHFTYENWMLLVRAHTQETLNNNTQKRCIYIPSSMNTLKYFKL